MTRYAHYRQAVRELRLPLAWLDRGALERNARALSTRAGGLPIRIATKSVRCRHVLEHVLQMPGYQGLMCFSAGEAAWLAEKGFDDLLVAYPSVDRHDLEACARWVARGKTLRLMVDDMAQLPALHAAAARAHTTLSVCMDVDMSSRFGPLWFGVRRSPVHDARAALRLARAVESGPGLRLDGVMGYEAQIAGLPDRSPGQSAKNRLLHELKKRSIAELRARRESVVRALREAGFAIPLVNGGGTGSLESTRRDPTVTEVSAGSGLYAPALFDHYADFRAEPAAGFAVPIVRKPARGLYTCHGGGFLASGTAGPDRLPRPYLPKGVKLTSVEGAGEVQTPIRYRGRETLGMGDPVFFRHAKAGELCEHFEQLWVIEGEGQASQAWPTYRGEGQRFP